MVRLPAPTLCAILLALLGGCQTTPDRTTIGKLRQVEPDLTEVHVDDSLVKAMQSYERFLSETPAHVMAPEAMRRLADLQIEKEYGVIGEAGTASVIDLPAPESEAPAPRSASATLAQTGRAPVPAGGTESDAAFEARASAPDFLGTPEQPALTAPEGGEPLDVSGPTQAIATYQKILADYPWYERNDQVLYQMARAYDELAQPDEAIRVVERLIAEYPDSRYVDEVYFRRGEYFFVRRQYLDAEEAYQAVVRMGEGSEFFELALYKLGWSLYKQELYEEALHQYVALLDYKLATGYDFDTAFGEDSDEGEERRVADTFRVISLSFTNLGGPEVLNEYFSTYGARSFEDRIYRNLAEFHFDKRRFNDAAAVYKAFVALNPLHKVAPHFSMRVSEIYAEGNFPLLVVESKKDFARRYGVKAEYWQYYALDSMPDVVEYLKTNLVDLAAHYHALYQEESLEEQRPANYGEALHWYDEFLASFPQDARSPGINYQLADLLLENGDFAESARQYERTAYDYPAHERSAEAGYAAIYAHRQNLAQLTGPELPPARLATVDSSLKFSETFPDHEHAAKVLGAATEDLYAMQDYGRAIFAGRWLIDAYPDADTALTRMAWMIVAHASFDTASYPDAEEGYAAVLALTAADDQERQSVVDNLAASIYKQGEQARLLEDYAGAADHFLRIKTAAPTSEIRAAAEYDAAAALIHLEHWVAAADVLEDFRSSFPEHELAGEATEQLAVVYENAGELNRSAAEYERVALDAVDPAVRAEALLVAGDLYEQAGSDAEALRVFEQYLGEYPEPVETALEIRHKVALAYEARGDDAAYLAQLRAIVDIDAGAGAARTDRTRYLGGTSALVLTRPLYDDFRSLRLTQPFEKSLAEKQRRMDLALSAFEALVRYEVGEVTAAATYYIAEIYGDFSEALLASERPAGLSAVDLAEYELVIEEEAYPFEERSIAVHQENLELLRAGVFNRWVEQSLSELAVLMPGRYAKHELSSGFVGSIDQYAYRSPQVPEPEPDTGSDAVSSAESPQELGPAAFAGVDDGK
ncbi:MAG: tetratricopeptide repeat protein [Pseudomonadales bacterium]